MVTIYDYKFVSIKDIKNQLQYKKIKEILDYLNIKGKKMIGIKQKELLLDYITNLQEENERLKAELELYKDNHNYLNDKIDKAIEMFDNQNLNKYYYGMSYEFEINDFKEDLLNILKGE